jgi:hypothetical protein
VNHLLFFGGVIVLATLLANMEIQVEGPHGWAKSLPTWRVDNRFTRAFLSGKPLTGYHLYLFSFVFIFVHLPFLTGLAPWTIGHEMRIMSFNFLFWMLEDFLWFVLNPAFGLSKFHRIHIWWHAPAWWWIAPRDYWMLTFLGGLFYFLSYRIA